MQSRFSLRQTFTGLTLPHTLDLGINKFRHLQRGVKRKMSLRAPQGPTIQLLRLNMKRKTCPFTNSAVRRMEKNKRGGDPKIAPFKAQSPTHT